MRKLILCLFFFQLFTCAYSQWQVGVGVGIANGQTDVSDKPYQQPKAAFSLLGGYQITDRFNVRGGLSFAKVASADSLGKNQFLKENRNLSFISNITEFSLVGEYTIFNMYNMRWSPYLFGGLAVYHFNPYTYDSANQQVFLQPLSTEGQGLTGYPNRKPYKLTQLAIPFGGGLKYAINDNVTLGLEVGLRRLFTDYLDDISTTYADPADLLAEKGPLAVSLSYRGDEAPGEISTYPDNGYPVKGVERGNPQSKDWYYFTMLHLTFKLNGNKGSRGRSGYGCPANPL